MASTAELVTDSVADLSKADGSPKTFWTMTMKERFAYAREVVTVEPILAAYVIAAYICIPAMLNLEVEKACRASLAYSDAICNAILHDDTSNATEEMEAPNVTLEIKAIQATVSNLHSWIVPLQSVVPLILVLFLGSYSDRHKLRKPFLVVPLFGELLAVAGCIVSVIFMKEVPLELHAVLQSVVPSFFGGQPMLIMAIFSYIADVSTVEMRTLRVGVVQIVLTACLPIAQSISGILFKELGYIWVLVIGGGVFLFGLLYGLFYVREPRKPELQSNKSFLADAFDPKQAIETFRLLIKKSPGNNRAFIFAVLVIYFIYSTVSSGEASVFYSYIIGPFAWGPLEYSYFSTASTVVHLVGTLVGVPLFTKLLHLSDVVILGLTVIDKIASNIVFGLATTGTMLYVAMVVSLITGITPIGIRSLSTKIVSQEDMGKAQSLYAIGEAVGPAIAAPVYNTLIFVNTLHTFPSAYFYFGALLYFICMILVVWMFFASKKLKPAQEIPDPNSLHMNMHKNGKGVEEYQTTHI